jgi:glycosyltransferase involved in cell wall biosynthesis
MSCGVPIVGYANAAFTGVVEHSGVGWVTPMNDPKMLAQQIQKLHLDRQQIVEHATRSLQFAMNHSFDQTFTRRVDHLLKLAKPDDATGTVEKTKSKSSMRQEGSVAAI